MFDSSQSSDNCVGRTVKCLELTKSTQKQEHQSHCPLVKNGYIPTNTWRETDVIAMWVVVILQNDRIISTSGVQLHEVLGAFLALLSEIDNFVISKKKITLNLILDVNLWVCVQSTEKNVLLGPLEHTYCWLSLFINRPDMMTYLNSSPLKFTITGGLIKEPTTKSPPPHPHTIATAAVKAARTTSFHWDQGYQ